MDVQRVIAFFAFALILYGTPGPATISLAASGAAYGFRRSLSYLLGLVLGILITLVVAAFGLGYLFTEFPTVHATLRYVSLAYILYLAYRIASSGMTASDDAKPLGFLQGVVLNLINPKAYVAAIAAITQFASSGDAYYRSVMLIIFFIIIVASIVDLGWAYAGQWMRKPFSSPRAAVTLNVTMAIVLVASVLIATFSF
jgi:threonine/homoserine/homoserine lactone efflux protein